MLHPEKRREMIKQIAYEEGFHDGYSQAMSEMPELVRCKDCHYGIRNSKEDIFCIKAIYNDKYKRPDWFCADGEHKEGR